MDIEVVFKTQVNDGQDIQCVLDWLHSWKNLDKTSEISVNTTVDLENCTYTWLIGFSDTNDYFEVGGNYGDYFLVLRCGKDYLFNKLNAGNLSKATISILKDQQSKS